MLLLTLSLCLGLTPLAWAGGKKDAQLVVAFLTLIPLALIPLGLACHWLILSLAPQRSRDLAQDLEDHYWKTLLLGIANGGILFVLAGVAAKGAPPVAFLSSLLLTVMTLLGLHGVARNLGDRLLRQGPQSKPPHPMRALAAGWFVLAYVGCLPFIGWGLAFWWSARGIGGVVLQIAGGRPREPSID